MARFPHDVPVEAVAQQAQERLDALGLEGEAGGKLDQQGAEPVAQFAHFAKEAVEQIGAVGQAPFVGDGFGHLDREAEAVRDGCGPAGIGRGLVRPVERTVDLDRREKARVALQMAAFRREEARMLTWDRPAGAADEYRKFAHAASTAA